MTRERRPAQEERLQLERGKELEERASGRMSTAPDAVALFIENLLGELREGQRNGQSNPVERRKLRTVSSNCGRKAASARFLADLQGRLAAAGIYSEPALADPSLRLEDWVLFSTGPFPPDSAFFPREKDLQRFVEASIGHGPFRHLEKFKAAGVRSGLEFRLPSGNRIDLLCQERTKAGGGALVAIEFKRRDARETVVQMVGYLNELKVVYPSRPARGMIISGREDRAAASLLKNYKDYDIEWRCYSVTFERCV